MAVQFFGQYLLEKGIITAEQLLKVVEYQELQNLRIGEFAIRQGLLSESDAARVNQLQLSQDIRFGEAAIQLGVLEDLDVQILLAAQRNSHIYFGEAVSLLRFATRENVQKALEAFKQDQATYRRGTIEVPDSVPVADLAANYFDLAVKLMLRYWGVNAKAGDVTAELRELACEGNTVSVALSGEVEATCFLAAPDGAAEQGGKQLLKINRFKPEELIDLTKELANLVCGNLAARLNQEGKTLTIAPPEVVTPPLQFTDQQVVRLVAATPHGPYTVAIAH